MKIKAKHKYAVKKKFQPGRATDPKTVTSLSTKKLKWECKAAVRATWAAVSLFVLSTAFFIFSICFCNIAF